MCWNWSSHLLCSGKQNLDIFKWWCWIIMFVPARKESRWNWILNVVKWPCKEVARVQAACVTSRALKNTCVCVWFLPPSSVLPRVSRVLFALPVHKQCWCCVFGPGIYCSDDWRCAVLDGLSWRRGKRSEVHFSCVHRSTQVSWFATDLLPFSQYLLRVHVIFLQGTQRFLICRKIWH